MRKHRGEKATGSPDVQPLLRCTFCRKSQKEVKRLITGPGVNICDECVGICLDIIAEDEHAPSAERPSVETPLSPMVACSLCRAQAPASDCVLVPERGVLCPGCLRAIDEAVDRKVGRVSEDDDGEPRG